MEDDFSSRYIQHYYKHTTTAREIFLKYRNIAEYECGFISVNHKSMIYFYFTCLYEHNINILCVRIVRHLLCLLLFSRKRRWKKKAWRKMQNLWMFETLSSGWELSKFRDFKTLFIEYKYVQKEYFHVVS